MSTRWRVEVYLSLTCSDQTIVVTREVEAGDDLFSSAGPLGLLGLDHLAERWDAVAHPSPDLWYFGQAGRHDVWVRRLPPARAAAGVRAAPAACEDVWDWLAREVALANGHPAPLGGRDT